MGSGVGPRVPLNGIQFLVDTRNIVSVDSSYVKDFISNTTATTTSTSLSGTGTTLGLLLNLASSVITFSNFSRLKLSSLTISSWIFPLSYGIGNSNGVILDAGQWSYPHYGYALRLNNISATLAIYYQAGQVITFTGGYINNSVELNKWQHFAVTHSGTTATFYKNGVSIGSSTVLGPVHPVTSATYIGNSAISDRAFDGKIASSRVYDRALSASEINQIYNSTKGRYL